MWKLSDRFSFVTKLFLFLNKKCFMESLVSSCFIFSINCMNTEQFIFFQNINALLEEKTSFCLKLLKNSCYKILIFRLTNLNMRVFGSIYDRSLTNTYNRQIPSQNTDPWCEPAHPTCEDNARIQCSFAVSSINSFHPKFPTSSFYYTYKLHLHLQICFQG